jgi:hypothetical protein
MFYNMIRFRYVTILRIPLPSLVKDGKKLKSTVSRKRWAKYIFVCKNPFID